MVINDLDIPGGTVCPAKAQTPLVVDADTPLTLSVSSEFFEPVAWRNPSILSFGRLVEVMELSPCGSPQIAKLAGTFPGEQCFGVAATEDPNYRQRVVRLAYYTKSQRGRLTISRNPGMILVARALDHCETMNIDFVDGTSAAVMEKQSSEKLYSFDKKHASRLKGIQRKEP